MQVTVVKCEKTNNLCKVQESKSPVPNVLTRENIEVVQIACKKVTGAKHGKSLANAKERQNIYLMPNLVPRAFLPWERG